MIGVADVVKTLPIRIVRRVGNKILVVRGRAANTLHGIDERQPPEYFLIVHARQSRAVRKGIRCVCNDRIGSPGWRSIKKPVPCVETTRSPLLAETHRHP